MRGLLNRMSGSALAVALASGLALAGAGMGAQPANAQGKKQQPSNSPEFVAVAQPLEQKVNAAVAVQKQAAAGDAAAKAQLSAALAGAPAMVVQAEAAAKTPLDKLAVGQYALNVGLMTNDAAMAARGAKNMLDSGLLDGAQASQIQQTYQKLTSLPQADPVLTQVDSLVRANNPQGALAELRKAVASKGAGQVPEAWLTRGAQIAITSKNANEAVFWSTKQVELHPTNRAWLGATQVVRMYGNLDPQQTMDVFRLMARSGALNNEARFVAPEYAAFAEAANSRAAYAEAVRIIDQGVAAGAITSSGRIGQIRTAANSKIAADRASLPGQERDARAAGNGIAALATADAYLNFGEAAKAEELYKLALQKGGIDNDRAYTRLGIAQFDQGKYAEARESFSKVAGARAQLGRLWLLLVNQKTGGAA